MVKTTAEISKTGACPEPLLNGGHLIRRWQRGSGPFFERAERAGLLRPVVDDGLLRYRWHDVLLFEGGLPPTDLAEAYAADLMHPKQVAEICCCKASFLQAAVRKGALPVGKTGRAALGARRSRTLAAKRVDHSAAPSKQTTPQKTTLQAR